MIIKEPIVTIVNGVARLSALVEYGNKTHELWFTVPLEYKNSLVTERSDAFLTSVLMLAMKRGEDIHIEGTISERLYINLVNYYMHLLTVLMPTLKKVNITYSKLDTGEAFESGDGVVMGFSGGIDSFAALHDHHFISDNTNYKVSHLVFNKVNDSDTLDCNEAQYLKLESFAKDMNLPYLKIDSNMHEFNDFPFVISYLIRNASALLAIQKLVSKYVIASSYKYEDISVGKTYSMGFSESITAPLLSTENMQTIISGAQHTRVQKTALVSEIPASYKFLDVCVSSDRQCANKNCSSCFKCLRTQLNLEILGRLDNYKNVFDLREYKKHRLNYVSRVLRRADEYDTEIYQLAKDTGFKFSLYEQFRSLPFIYYPGRFIKRTFARRLLQSDDLDLQIDNPNSEKQEVFRVKHELL